MITASAGRSFAEEKRAEIRARAATLGIDEAFISRLVERFYARVRSDAMLGPIFEREIGDHWEPHLARMKEFWASVALNAGIYSGRPVPVHQRLDGVSREHFAHWLELFRETLVEIAPGSATVEYFLLRAERIATSLQMAMFDRIGSDGAPPDLRAHHDARSTLDRPTRRENDW
jgi:hemoglobin